MEITHPKIHGHAVIDMMTASSTTYSNASLEQAIHSKFGVNARFHTCSAENMTASELINCLWDKGKFSGTTDAFQFDPSKRCNH